MGSKEIPPIQIRENTNIEEEMESQLKKTFIDIRNSVKNSKDEIRGSFNQLGSKGSLLKSVLL